MNATKPPWIFVHVQKTGGNSVRTALGGDIFDARKHFTARELRDFHGQTAWSACFKFSFVRNPWDRLVSWWSMIDSSRDYIDQAQPPNSFFGYVLGRARSFEDFLSRCDDEIVDSDGRKNIFRNQIDYLVDDNGTIIVDFVGRFERLQEGFDEICHRLGRTSVELPRTNVSRHAAYTDYYTPATAEIVARRYARDIAQFGYRFGQ
jgi:chondroitin 4-sulfotransferase 11